MRYTKNKVTRGLVLLCFLATIGSKSMAQFHTIQAEKPINTGEVKPLMDSVKPEKRGEIFLPTKGITVEVEGDVPLFVNVSDSLLLGTISKRLSVCLPLDFMRQTSTFGTRQDPISRCAAFHDGIDLGCNGARVYAMLPGVVKEVRHGKHGYGNYVVLQHGRIECLYGHLAGITVREGEFVYAGTIVGISGNTGKSTAPHLHIRLRKDGRSIDPQVFIASLNGYIDDLKASIAMAKGIDLVPPLTIANLASSLQRHKVKFPNIVIAQALLETGYFTSRVCLEHNNLFGLRRPSDGGYYHFDNWEESIRAYRDYVQYKYHGGDYYRFLQRIGYAEDVEYMRKVRKIAISLQL